MPPVKLNINWILGYSLSVVPIQSPVIKTNDAAPILPPKIKPNVFLILNWWLVLRIRKLVGPGVIDATTEKAQKAKIVSKIKSKN